MPIASLLLPSRRNNNDKITVKYFILITLSVLDNRGGKSPPRSGVSILTAWFFARASRGRMAVGRLTAAILPRAKRGGECLGFFLNASFRKKLVGLSRCAPQPMGFQMILSLKRGKRVRQRLGRMAWCNRRSSQKRRFRTNPQAPFTHDYTGNGSIWQ